MDNVKFVNFQIATCNPVHQIRTDVARDDMPGKFRSAARATATAIRYPRQSPSNAIPP